ncbi:protein FAM3C [Nematolebias whitei]|uniref:protein FAM3C n=1 Tax=Nematolebias whitei TaxID=451745 RepID=UPI001898BD19|nr:protein FAM3C [Nematolebias whitei]
MAAAPTYRCNGPAHSTRCPLKLPHQFSVVNDLVDDNSQSVMEKAVLTLTAAAVFLFITIRFFMDSADAHEKSKKVLAWTSFKPKCSLPRVCPPDHFAFRIRSGAANVVGPQICFEGHIIMSHILNNVGPGLNMVIVNGENGAIEKVGFLNLIAGNKEDILAYLKEIKPGKIVLVASFINAATKMTKEMRDIFVDMGSSLIHSVRHRDNWVFAGRSGTSIKSLFEKQVANDEKTNAFDGWPQMVEVGGCFPRNLNASQ